MRVDGLQVLEDTDSEGTVDGREVVEELGQGWLASLPWQYARGITVV